MLSLPFSKLADVYEALEGTRSGLAMRDILSRFFKATPKGDIDKIAYLTLGRIGPEYEEIELGMAEKMVLRAIAVAFERGEDEVRREFKKKGDAGLVAEALAGRGRDALTVSQVFDKLWEIQAATGPGSQERKIKILAEMLRAAFPKEARYLTRIALGTLRLGTGTMTVLDSLAIAFTGTKANKPKLEHAYNICSDIGAVARAVATKGLAGVVRFDVIVGRPIKMMLAQRVPSIAEIKEKIPGAIAIEEKYDGERIQVHKKGREVVLYSRRQENITHQFPDVVAAVLKQISARECVIEGEAVAIKAEDVLLPFQVLMQRRRKYEIERYVKQIPVCLYLFDLLYLNGRSYINRPYLERRAALRRITRDSPHLKLARNIVTEKVEEIEEFFNEALNRGCEGILAKSTAPDSVYQAGTRGWLWIKWKREYAKEIRETFDLVIIGAFMGRGIRSGTYGALLAAVYNPKSDRFESFCKVGSGFTEEQLFELPKKLARYRIPRPSPRVWIEKAMEPDVHFDPKIVIEVLGAEITKSPTHTAAREHFKDAGLALRFPRFLNYRPDKGPEDATTTEEIIRMYSRR